LLTEATSLKADTAEGAIKGVNMALFTDGSISNLEDLRAYESSIFEVASTERIDLSKKLALAQQELETELGALLRQRYERQGLGDVVVTRPLRQWHVFQTLALAYRDAYNSHLNDRYLGKWKEYLKLAQWAWGKLLESGIGIAQSPIPKAALPRVIAGVGSLAGGTYWIRVAWTSAAGEEGCPSDPANLAVPDGSSLVVEAVNPPGNATGWNVYVGPSAGETRRQNGEPMAPGASWQLADPPSTDGDPAGEGQAASYFLTQRRVLQRG